MCHYFTLETQMTYKKDNHTQIQINKWNDTSVPSRNTA
jgi:hypothetical protein